MQHSAHIHAGQQHTVGVGDTQAHQVAAGAGVHAHLRELQGALLVVCATVLQQDGDGHFARVAQAACSQPFAQLQQFSAGLIELDVHGIEPLHSGQRSALLGRDQGTGRHRRFPNVPSNGRGDTGVIELNALGLHAGLGRLHVRLGLQQGGLGILVILAAGGMDARQRGGALCRQTGRLQRGLGTCQCRFAAGQLGAVGGIVELVERLPGLNHAALGEQALAHDAIHLRPHFGHQGGQRTPRQLPLHGHAARRQRDHTHRHRGGVALRGRRTCAATTSCQQSGGKQRTHSTGLRGPKRGKNTHKRTGWEHANLSQKVMPQAADKRDSGQGLQPILGMPYGTKLTKANNLNGLEMLLFS